MSNKFLQCVTSSWHAMQQVCVEENPERIWQKGENFWRICFAKWIRKNLWECRRNSCYVYCKMKGMKICQCCLLYVYWMLLTYFEKYLLILVEKFEISIIKLRFWFQGWTSWCLSMLKSSFFLSWAVSNYVETSDWYFMKRKSLDLALFQDFVSSFCFTFLASICHLSYGKRNLKIVQEKYKVFFPH